jgi:hypothetical protein
MIDLALSLGPRARPKMDLIAKLQLQIDQLRTLAADTTDPLAVRLIGDAIAELEDELTKAKKEGEQHWGS